MTGNYTEIVTEFDAIKSNYKPTNWTANLYDTVGVVTKQINGVNTVMGQMKDLKQHYGANQFDCTHVTKFLGEESLIKENVDLISDIGGKKLPTNKVTLDVSGGISLDAGMFVESIVDVLKPLVDGSLNPLANNVLTQITANELNASINKITGTAADIVEARNVFGNGKLDGSLTVIVDQDTIQGVRSSIAGTLANDVIAIRKGYYNGTQAKNPMDQGRIINIANVKLIVGQTSKVIEMHSLSSSMSKNVVLRLQKEGNASGTSIDSLDTVAGYNNTQGGGQIDISDIDLIHGDSSKIVNLLVKSHDLVSNGKLNGGNPDKIFRRYIKHKIASNGVTINSVNDNALQTNGNFNSISINDFVTYDGTGVQYFDNVWKELSSTNYRLKVYSKTNTDIKLIRVNASNNDIGNTPLVLRVTPHDNVDGTLKKEETHTFKVNCTNSLATTNTWATNGVNWKELNDLNGDVDVATNEIQNTKCKKY